MRGKAFAIALVAISALGALTASAALASQGMSEGNVNVLLKGEQIGRTVFSLESTSVECEVVTAETSGEVASPASSLTVHPTYSNCVAFGFLEATINSSGCNYVETIGSQLAADEYSGTAELSCSVGSKIAIAGGTCEVTIAGPQKFSEGLKAVNNTAATPKDVVLKFSVSGIAVTKTKDGFLCPLNGTGSATATYKGETTGRGFHSGTQVGVTFEP
jgi:hypothetical protein